MIEPRFSDQTYANIIKVMGELSEPQRQMIATISARAWLDALAQLDGPLVAADIAYRLADEYVA